MAGAAVGAAGLDWLAPAIYPDPVDVDLVRSHWASALAPPLPPLGRSVDADVVVVGGGLTGLATALHLCIQAPEQRVVLLEARRCGNGASGRNGAMLLTMTPDRWLQPSAQPALDRAILQLTSANIDALRSLAERFAVDVELDVTGAVHALCSPGEARAAQEAAARLADAGLPVEYWGPERMRDELGTGAYSGALFDAASGQVHPGRLVALLRHAAVTSGAEVYEGSCVVSIEEGATHVLHTAAGHRVRAPTLILATNAYSSQLGYLRNDYFPLTTHVGITRPLDPETVARLGWKCRAPFDDSLTREHWIGITRDQRVRIGGGPHGYGYGFNNAPPASTVPVACAGALAAELERLYPVLGSVEFERSWSGLVDCSLNMTPSVGRLGRHRNIYYAIGFSGHGVNLATLFGRVLADLVTGHDERWRWLPYLNLRLPYVPNEPIRWLGTGAVEAILALLRE